MLDNFRESLTLLMTYRKSSKSSLLYIIQCLSSAAKILLYYFSADLSAKGYRRGDYWSYFIIVDMMSNELPKACDKD